MIVYLIGALKNKKVPPTARLLRAEGWDVYDEWHCPGPETDQFWQSYCRKNNLSYQQALEGWHAKQVFAIDLFHLDRCDVGILLLPAGKSGHLELGYLKGLGKPVYILLDKEPKRYDLMYRFADLVTTNLKEIIDAIHQTDSKKGRGRNLTKASGNSRGAKLPADLNRTGLLGQRSHPRLPDDK